MADDDADFDMLLGVLYLMIEAAEPGPRAPELARKSASQYLKEDVKL
jgi:hypothetical protein